MEYELTGDCSLEILKFSDEEGAKTFRHTASHILAQAVKKLYPEAKLAIGPALTTDFTTISIWNIDSQKRIFQPSKKR